jgi:hypothetical protein
MNFHGQKVNEGAGIPMNRRTTKNKTREIGNELRNTNLDGSTA